MSDAGSHPPPPPVLLGPEEIRARLKLIFPGGLDNQEKLTALATARAIFAMLYISAIQGHPSGRQLQPKQVYRMSDEQAGLTSDADREAYARASVKAGYQPPGRPWYNDNTREPIRDDALRYGLVSVGAVLVDKSVPTTSNRGRYTLQADFAKLFDPALEGEGLEKAAAEWRQKHLSQPALMRVRALLAGAQQSKSSVLVNLPNGEVKKMSPGESSVMTKDVIEVFAEKFLESPAVIWISESGNKVVAENFALAKSIGLNIVEEKLLPDIVLADLGEAADTPILIFFEIVATDGPVSEARREELLALALEGGFSVDDVAFVSVFWERNHPAFKKNVASLAVGSFAWFRNEPDVLMWIRHRETPVPAKLRKLVEKRT